MAKKTILQQRIETLFEKAEYINKIEPDLIVWHDLATYTAWMSTTYGNRRFYLSKKCFKYCNKEDNRTIFKIIFKRNNVNIEPITDLTPQEIDLAILEIEDALTRHYLRCRKKELAHEKTVKYFNEQRMN